MDIKKHIEPTVLVAPEANLSDRVVLLVVDRNEPTDIEVVMSIIKVGSFDGFSIKVLPYDSKTKDRILDTGADLVLLYENAGNSSMKLLTQDLEQDFRTSFLPVILLEECSGDQISFQENANTLNTE